MEKDDNKNSGYWNSGDKNSGDWNSGYKNSGHCNSGHKNSGHKNSGHKNSGYWNSGDWNSGDWNSGDWNSGDKNSGYCNSDSPNIRIFNKETTETNIVFPNYFYFDINVWVKEKDMTEFEKEKNWWYKTTGGYLQKLDYKESWKKSFFEATLEDVKKTLDLPNFDYAIFEEISGISKSDFDKKLKDEEQ